MRESRFISQNLNKWKRIEEGANGGKLPPDALEAAFVELNEDLGYAKTFYPNRSVRVFLNNLLTPIYTKIHRASPWKWKSIRDFFVDEVPLSLAQSQKFILISFISVAMGFLFGFFGTKIDKNLPEIIMGKAYVAQTEENIKSGKPMAIYNQGDGDGMFLHIFTNNLKVGIMVFAMGAFLCIGALYILFFNGVMLGVFTYFMFSHGVTKEFGLTVFQHGTIEILSMVIEGAAGMIIGAGILFPGTLSRTRSMQNMAQKGVKILVVCLPLILIAAIIESYITRHTEWNNIIRFTVIIVSFIFMLGYFVIFPMVKYGFNKKLDGVEKLEEPDANLQFSTKSIYPVGSIFLFGFSYLKKNFNLALVVSVVFLILGLGTVYYFKGETYFITEIKAEIDISATEIQDNANSINVVSSVIAAMFKFVFISFWLCKFIFHFAAFPILMPLVFITMSWILFMINKRNKYDNYLELNIWKEILAATVPTLFFIGITWLMGSAWWLSLIFNLPLSIIWSTNYYNQFKNIITSFFATVKLWVINFWKYIGCVATIFLIYFLVSIGIWFFLIQVLAMGGSMFKTGSPISESTLQVLIGLCYFIMPLMLTLSIFIFKFFMFSAMERAEGYAIMENLKQISFRKEVYGVETE